MPLWGMEKKPPITEDLNKRKTKKIIVFKFKVVIIKKFIWMRRFYGYKKW